MANPDGPVREPSFRRRLLGKACVAGVVLGCLFQVTLRDYFPFPWATIYYALPRPVLLALALVCCINAADRRTRRTWIGVSALLAGLVAWSDVAWHSSTTSKGTPQTVVFWNVGHDLINDVAVVDGFLDRGPAILGLVETGPVSPEWLAEWQTRHPEYQFVMPDPGCLLAVRGEIKASGLNPIAYRSYVAWVEAEIDGQPVRAAVVDIVADVNISRREPLNGLNELLAGWKDGPLVVMGDFNTPDDSLWMADLRRNFREVFRAAGQGYVPTWPWPVPVLKLDQIWVNRFFDVHAAWQQATWRSDHRAQWAEISRTNEDDARLRQ